MQIKAEIKKVKLTHIILFGLIFLALIISLPFANSIEILLKLKPNLNFLQNNSLQVHFVDVGQGEAILIRFPNNETMLVDSGPVSAKNNLINYINNVFFLKGEQKYFNYILLTHSDDDHSGNMEHIVTKYKFNTFIRPKIYVEGVEEKPNEGVYHNSQSYKNLINKLLNLKANNNINIIESRAGILEDNEFLTFYSPNSLVPYADLNNYSPILKVKGNNKSILLTGDAEEKIELEVLANSYDVKADVLNLGHHGSSTSTNLNFLKEVNPKYFVVSASKNNISFPSGNTLINLESYCNENNLNLNAALFNTGNKGNIICYVNADSAIQFKNIEDINDYLFISWYAIFGIIVAVGVIIVIIIYRKQIFLSFKKVKSDCLVC